MFHSLSVILAGWREKRDTVVIFVRGFATVLWCQTSQEHGSSFGIFRSAKRLDYQQQE